MNKVTETVLEINLKHLTHNYTYLKSKLQAGVKILTVVKANSYGSDAIIIANHLQKLGADYLAVAYTAEGVSLRESGIQIPILVLHPQPTNFETLIEYRLTPNIYSLRVLTAFIAIAEQKLQTDYPVHIKCNTGLNRLGFHKDTIDTLLATVTATKAIKIAAVFSHLAASEDLSEDVFTQQQIAAFRSMTDTIIARLGYRPILHQCNTSGILNYPEAHFDMVRTGIGLYGFGNAAQYDTRLKPISALKSVVSQIHTLAAGETVGYNRAFIAQEPTRTATIPIGHADGINRIYGHRKGYVTIHGQKAYIIGNVCMDMIMVDITAIACEEGDEVIVFDAQHAAASLAESAGTISYELITAISARVKRVVIDDI